MPADLNFFDQLSDPQLKSGLMRLLGSGLSPEAKYASLIDFFHHSGGTEDFLLSLAMLAAENGGENDGSEASAGAVAGSLLRVLRRLNASQHADGGWGPYVETSSFWNTALSVLFLDAAYRNPALLAGGQQAVDYVFLLRRGCAYLEQAAEQWAADTLPAQGALSIYQLSLMSRVFFNGCRAYFRRDTGVRVYRSIAHLYQAQNEDGGWDACLWGYDVTTPVRVFSEVGATAAALRALAQVADERLLAATERGVHWLINTQNVDGSWSSGSCRPDLPAFTLTGDPRVSKTCDAICGLVCSHSFDGEAEPYRTVLRRALVWLQRRMQPVLNKHRNPAAWGWGFTADDYQNVLQVFETLLALPAAPRALLSPYAGWLLRGQHRAGGDAQDGAWVLGDTARTALALEAYLRL